MTQSHKPVWIALIILFLLMLAGGGWLYQQINRDQQQQAERFSSFNDALTTVQSATSEQQRELIALNEQLQAQSDKLDEFISRETLTSEELKEPGLCRKLNTCLMSPISGRCWHMMLTVQFVRWRWRINRFRRCQIIAYTLAGTDR